jgi:hypothetical protein
MGAVALETGVCFRRHFYATLLQSQQTFYVRR